MILSTRSDPFPTAYRGESVMTTTLGNATTQRLPLRMSRCTLACASPASAHGDGAEKLGTVAFPTSCNPPAQVQFERGVAALHSFWFAEADKAFQAAAQAD